MSDPQTKPSDEGSTRTSITDTAPAPPPKTADPPDEPVPNIATGEPTVMQVFFAWEQIRLFFLIPSVVVLLALAFSKQVDFCCVLGILLIGNFGFCAGPVLENYLCWFGLPRSVSRCVAVGSVILCVLLFLSGMRHRNDLSDRIL